MSDVPDVAEMAQGRRIEPANEFDLFRVEEIEQSIPERFQQQVVSWPDHLAVGTKRERFTYSQLNEISNSIANSILQHQGDREEPVAVLMEQSALVIAAIMGVLKAGKIYVPLDTQLPVARLSYMMADSQATSVVTQAQHVDLATKLVAKEIPVFEADSLQSGLSTSEPDVKISPDRNAYIIYTSGSTGRPKGVFQNHRNLLFEIFRVTNSFHVCRNDRLALLHSYSSSAALRRIFPALLNGASVHPLDLKTQSIADLPDWFVEEQITISNGRRLLRDCAQYLTGENQFPYLRLVTFGGEPVYRRDMELYKKYLPPHSLMLINLATTETGSDTQFFISKEMEISGSLLPVGYPTVGTEIMILDEDGRQTDANQVGEIAVKSPYISLGYWQKSELTRERFLPDPNGSEARIYLTGDLGRMDSTGCLFHVGRKDFQVKVRGYRIEPMEIETLLMNLGTFHEVVVLSRSDSSGENRLLAYLLPMDRPVPTASFLKRKLSETLPEYMIPSAFIFLDEFPRTPTGKVDRRALPSPGHRRPNLDHPAVTASNLIEEVLSRIWAEKLEIDEVGIHDDFLELGGDSLRAAQILSRISEIFQIKLSMRILFETSTVAKVTQALVAREPEPGWIEAIARAKSPAILGTIGKSDLQFEQGNEM